MANNGFQVRALFAFSAEASGELSFNADETLLVTADSEAPGWWYAANTEGQMGLIPQNYVQPIETVQPTGSEVPSAYENPTNDFSEFDMFQNTDYVTLTPQVQVTSPPEHEPNVYEDVNYSNDDWAGFEQSLASPPTMPQSNDDHITDSFKHVSFFSDESSSDPFPTPDVSYMHVVDTLNPQQSAFASPINPLALHHQQMPYQENSQPSAFDFAQGTYTPQQTLFEDSYITPTMPSAAAPTPVETYYPMPSSLPSPPLPTAVTMRANNPTPSPALVPTPSAVADAFPTSSTSKKSEEKKKFFTLGRSKTKSVEQNRPRSIETTRESQPKTGKDDGDSNSFSDLETHSSSNQNQVPGSGGSTEPKAPARARFFDKHGLDNYILNGTKIKSEESNQILNDEGEGGMVHWLPHPAMPPFTCKIEEPCKGTKLGGLKAFMEYKIHAQIPGARVVGRRYKQFDWLHEQLVNKFRFVCVPPLPGKQIAGRFEQDFIEERRRQLELWLNRICYHPVLCASFPVQHFVTCELTEKNNKEWKNGKRKIEKDESREASWLQSVTLANAPLSDATVLSRIEVFAQQQPGLETHMRNLGQGIGKYLERHTEVYERDFQRLGELFSKVHLAFQVDTNTPGNSTLTNSIGQISNSYNAIGELYKTKAIEGLRDLNEHLQEYIGLLACFPAILGIQRSAAEFIRSVQQRGPAATSDLAGALHRNTVFHHVVLAEINHFQKEKVHDFLVYLKTFMNEQIQFYEKVTSELRNVSSTFA